MGVVGRPHCHLARRWNLQCLRTLHVAVTPARPVSPISSCVCRPIDGRAASGMLSTRASLRRVGTTHAAVSRFGARSVRCCRRTVTAPCSFTNVGTAAGARGRSPHGLRGCRRGWGAGAVGPLGFERNLVNTAARGRRRGKNKKNFRIPQPACSL